MSDKNTLLLISDNQDFVKLLEKKLIFLRHDDSIQISCYDNALENLEIYGANIVFVHENFVRSKTIELIRELRKNKNLCILLLANSCDSDFILASYDVGIDDFALSNAEAFELVVRTVNNIKHNSNKLKLYRNLKLLEQLNVIDSYTGLYNYNYAKQVIENVIDDNLLSDGIFMVVSPSETSKNQFSIEKMSEALLASVRVDDIVTLGRGAKFYILLPNTDINGAVVVINKIIDNYGGNFEICAGISMIAHKNFDEMEREALRAQADAVATNAQYVVAEEPESDTLDEWLEDADDKPKNYKIFRQIFNKKMEKVITPVFYRLQKAWEEKLFNTEIEQYTDGEQCVFHLKNNKQDSTLKIVYPGFAKIIISITHEGLDSPENSEIQLPLTKINQKKLISIVEDFIKDFKYTSV